MDVVFWRGWLNLEETESLNCHIGLHQWHSYQPSAKFCLKEAWKIWLQMIWGHLSCYYASWLPNCWKNCHLPWVIYSVPKTHPLAHVNLLNFGQKTAIEIWSFPIGAVKEVQIVRTKCVQVGIHCFVNS